MKVILTLTVLFLSCLPALADTRPTQIRWKEWSIASSENLWAGRIHTNHPLTYLVDNDPRTAWVFSGTKNEYWRAASWGYRHAIALQRHEKPVTIDSIALMNGYNKRRDLFWRNNRVVQVDIWINRRKVKTATLPDKMGWHRISVPRQSVGELKIAFTGIRKGRDNDICISELALLNRSRKIDLHLPQAVLFSPGGDDDYNDKPKRQKHEPVIPGGLTSRNGKLIHKSYSEYEQWSPNGRYVCDLKGVNQDPNNQQLWVADVRRGSIVFRKTIPTAWLEGFKWQDNETLKIIRRKNDKNYIQTLKIG